MTVIRPRRPRRSGVAVVEFALTAPLLFLLMLGIWEYGRLIQAAQVVYMAARDGGRIAATGQASAAQVQAYVLLYLQRSGLGDPATITSGVVVNVKDLTNTAVCDTAAGNAGDLTTMAQLDQISVQVTVPTVNFQWVTYLFTSPSITAESVWPGLVDQPLANTPFVLPPL